MRTRLILARHGESTVNVIHLASDDHENNPLTALGLTQAEALASEIATISHVYTSPTQRARETGAVVAERRGVPSSIEWGLEEIRVGVHEGEQGSVALTRGLTDFRRWLAEADLEHGYEGGENGRDVAVRVSDALRRIVAREPGSTVLVVSHGGALALALPMLCQNITYPVLFERQLLNCGVVEVVIDDGVWTCVRWQGIRPENFDIESVA
jgi:probable phosphoglycerate mutase